MIQPEQMVKFDTTTYKALVGQRILIATGIVIGGAFVGQLVTGNDTMAKTLLEAWLYFLAIAVLGVNAAQYGVQRFSAKEYKAASEHGKATGAAAALVLSETALDAKAARNGAPTEPPAPATTIIARDQSTVINEAEADAQPAAPVAPRPTGDARVDDERGEP